MNAHTLNSGHRLNIRSYDEHKQSHYHSYHQLILPQRGSLLLQCSHHTGDANPAMAAIIPAGESHTFCSLGENSFWVLDVVADGGQHEELFDRSSQSPFVPMGPAVQSQLAFARLQRELPNNPHMLLHWSQLLLHTMAEQNNGDKLTTHKRLRTALSLMRTRISREFDATQLASELHMSVTQLHRLFRQQLDTTPQHWMSSLRMQHALHLIASNCTLAHVAQSCGFADQSSFGKAFKRFYGQTPASYRKELLAQSTTGQP